MKSQNSSDKLPVVEHLPWDSRILGRKSGVVLLPPDFCDKGPNAEKALRDCLAKARQEGFQFVTAKIDSDRCELVDAFLRNDGFLADTEVCFTKKPDNAELTAGLGISFLKTASYWDDSLYGIAETLNLSRFFRDPTIGAESAVKLWKESLYNHCTGRATYSVIAFQENRPAGVINVIEKDNVSNIFLIGVLPDFQGQRIGKMMIRFYEQNISKEITEMTVDTQLTNLNAQKLYINSGYRIKCSQHIIHFRD